VCHLRHRNNVNGVRRVPYIDYTLVEKLYREGKTDLAIGMKLNISPSLVTEWRKCKKLPKVSKWKTPKFRYVPENVPEEDTQSLLCSTDLLETVVKKPIRRKKQQTNM
jgi:hypothetical protein